MSRDALTGVRRVACVSGLISVVMPLRADVHAEGSVSVAPSSTRRRRPGRASRLADRAAAVVPANLAECVFRLFEPAGALQEVREVLFFVLYSPDGQPVDRRIVQAVVAGHRQAVSGSRHGVANGAVV